MASRFINARKLRELREAMKNGNEKAKVIIDKYMEDKPDMESIDRLLDEYYSDAGIDTLAAVAEPEPEKAPEQSPAIEDGFTSDPYMDVPDPADAPTEIHEEIKPAETKPAMEELPETPDPQPEVEAPAPAFPDITGDLDRELDGLIDIDEISDYSFGDYLGTKRKNANRAKKNAAYFKAFDQAGRDSYLSKKKEEYARGLDGKLRDADRHYNDIDMAMGEYDKMVTDMPDDDAEIDVSVASSAYDDLTGDEATMGAFGRGWDAQDNESIKSALSALVAKYGKRNVMAALNTLRDDNKAWHDESRGRIESSISKYGKALDDLLK